MALKVESQNMQSDELYLIQKYGCASLDLK